MNKIIENIERLRKERKWTVYRLSDETGIPQNTIHNWFYRDTVPTITILEQLCEGFGITLADFFAENKMIEITHEKKQLHDKFYSLSKESQKIVIDLMNKLT
jgi:transcriptional regulator with XRE-family HTH domain